MRRTPPRRQCLLVNKGLSMRIFRLKHLSLSGLIALALSASLGLGVAIASESDSSQSIKTVLKLKTGDGSSETLRFDGALAVGEARG